MVKLSVTEKYREETREEAEDFIRAQRENGAKDGYDITKAEYTQKDKKKAKEIVDSCEVVTITKVYCDIWSEE